MNGNRRQQRRAEWEPRLGTDGFRLLESGYRLILRATGLLMLALVAGLLAQTVGIPSGAPLGAIPFLLAYAIAAGYGASRVSQASRQIRRYNGILPRTRNAPSKRVLSDTRSFDHWVIEASAKDPLGPPAEAATPY